MRSPINIVGGFYKDPNKHWSAQDTLNWIPVKSERSGTRTEWQFRDAPGVKPLVKLGVNSGGDFIEAGPGRGLRNVEGKLFAVAGNTLFQITNDLVSIPYGTIPGVTRVSMAHNQYGSANQLLTVNGSAGYVFNTSTLVFEKITDTGYPGAFVADYVDGYLAQVESLGRYWFHSDLAEAREYNTLDQYEAEGDPDRIVTLHVAYREVLLFGADTIEPYVNAPRGSGIAPFQRAANTVIQCGCSAKFSPRNIAGVVPFLDDKRVVQYLQGYSVNRISTVGIEQALGECSREEISNAYAYTYEDRGHKIYYLTVPGRFTFGYDFLTQEWHRRATSGLPDLAFTDVAFWNGMWVALDRRYGRLYELDWGYKLDSCEPLVRERVTGVLSNNQNRVTVNELELLFNVGTEISVCQPFEEQPEGPTISGTLPDGSVALPWAGGTFTAANGTPPYSFSSRPGTVFPGNLGPLLTTGVVAAEVPDTAGVGTVVARVVDANGLFAETTAMFVIAPPTMAIYGTNAVNSSDYRVGSGINWPGSWTLRLGIQGTYGLIGTEETFVLYQVTGHPLYSEDFGATFPASTGAQQNGSGGARHGWYSRRDNVVALPQASGNGVNISQDKGRTYTATGTYSAASVACIEKPDGENRWIIIQDSDIRAGYSIDKFTTQSSFTAIPDASFAIDCPTWANSEFCLVGGSTPFPYAPKLWKTTDGVTLTPETLPAGLTGQAIVVIGGGTIGDNEYIIIATDTGKRAYLDPADGEWKMCSTDFVGRPWDIAYNEAVIAMIGGNQSSGDTDGYIDYTLDGENFTTSLTWPLNSGENGRAIAAMITP